MLLLRGLTTLIGTTYQYYEALCFFTLQNGSLRSCPLFKDHPHRQVHMFSLSRTLRLWHEPHYRAASFQADIHKNLANVAAPGTGFALSLFATSQFLFIVFLLAFNPVASCVAALYLAIVDGSDFGQKYAELLLEPTHWFAIWRLNSALVAYHAFITNSQSYSMEDKGTFLLRGEQLGLPVSPFLKEPALVLKHKNIEGGMAIHFFKNFACGGDWILQRQLKNSEAIAALLPRDAPLSTLRVITSSTRLTPTKDATVEGQLSINKPTSAAMQQADTTGISVVTVVFRAGLAGASTDHKSICFNVDPSTGTIGTGVSNQHWYKLGFQHVGRVSSSISTVYSYHPDSHVEITGRTIPDMQGILELVQRGHSLLVPDVPLVGWDVALTNDGTCLLEINISCNFFNGAYDKELYTSFMLEGFAQLQEQDNARFWSWLGW